MEAAEIITALGALIGAIGGVYSIWTKYNQTAKDKKTEFEIEQLKRDMHYKNERRMDNVMIIAGRLSNLLDDMDAARVYVVQPHPLRRGEFLSIQFEQKQGWASSMKDVVKRLRIEDVPRFSEFMAKNIFADITNVDEQVNDRFAQSIFHKGGTQRCFIKRLSDQRHDWVGSIFVEYTRPTEITSEAAREMLHQCSTDIQYILPEIVEEDEIGK